LKIEDLTTKIREDQMSKLGGPHSRSSIPQSRFGALEGNEQTIDSIDR